MAASDWPKSAVEINLSPTVLEISSFFETKHLEVFRPALRLRTLNIHNLYTNLPHFSRAFRGCNFHVSLTTFIVSVVLAAFSHPAPQPRHVSSSVQLFTLPQSCQHCQPAPIRALSEKREGGVLEGLIMLQQNIFTPNSPFADHPPFIPSPCSPESPTSPSISSQNFLSFDFRSQMAPFATNLAQKHNILKFTPTLSKSPDLRRTALGHNIYVK